MLVEKKMSVSSRQESIGPLVTEVVDEDEGLGE